MSGKQDVRGDYARDPADVGQNIIAIDGPSGSGKSTVASQVAAQLGLQHLDTGAMYRAVALLALEADIPLGDGVVLGRISKDMSLEMAGQVLLDGRDVSERIREGDVSDASSKVAVHPQVRSELVSRQRLWAEKHGGGVLEGRDITTVVFPRARVKVYLHADVGERAQRRVAQRHVSQRSEGETGDLVEGGPSAECEQSLTTEELAKRDSRDSSRAHSPLTVSDQATSIDTTHMTISEVVDSIVLLWNEGR